ncbi:branched-chain amino acid ABC transporter permease [Bacillus sp. 1P10SD]|uniref:branched-chain amino acid ABC transporter permease n=1 Tax=Bacillus sp. 1P10SD TaxID=3132265 RepID=UPI0039A5F3F0
MLIEQLVNALSQGAFYALFAAGLTLIFGVLHILNMAHGSMFIWGSFTAWILITRVELPFFLAILIAIFCSGVYGLVINEIGFKPLRKKSSSYLPPLVSSLALSIILVNVAELVFGTRVVRYNQEEIPLQTTFSFLGRDISLIQIILFLLALILMGGLWILINKTKIGREIKAIEENPVVASLLGINIERSIRIMFFLAAALAGIAGIFIGIAFNTISPYMGEVFDLKGFAIIVLGGMGSIPGALLGGFILGFGEIATVTFLDSNYRDAFVFSLLLLILFFKPNGLFGYKGGDRA